MKHCPFCERPADSAEHVYARWITRHFVSNGIARAGFDLNMGPALGGARRAKSLNQTVKVCATCNNGWMSALEDRAQAVLLGLVYDRDSRLGCDEQQVLAHWLFKTAAVHERLLPSDSVSRHADRLLLAAGRVPTGWSAHVAGAEPAGNAIFTYHMGPIVTCRHDDGALRGQVRVHTMRFGRFASQVVLHSLDVTPTFEDLLGGPRFSAQIWPPRAEACGWPPGTTLLPEWFDLVTSLKTAAERDAERRGAVG